MTAPVLPCAAPPDLRQRADWLAGHLSEIPAEWLVGQLFGVAADPARAAAALEALAQLMRRLPVGPAIIVADRDLIRSRVRLRMLGIHVTGHQGLIGACGNWIAAARHIASRGTR